MNNDEQCQQLQAYLQDDLDQLDRSTFEAHLTTCPSCTDELIRDAWAGVSTPVDLAANINQQTKVSVANSVANSDGRSWNWSTLIAVAAAIALLGTLAFFVTRSDTGPRLSGNDGSNSGSIATPDQTSQIASEQAELTNQNSVSQDPVVTFYQTGSGNQAILVSVPSTSRDANFTIVHALQPVNLTSKQPATVSPTN